MSRSDDPRTVRRRILDMLAKVERDVTALDVPELDGTQKRLAKLRAELERVL